MTWVKICGIRELQHALAAVDAGADAIGLVFASSRRHITPQQAKAIVGGLPTWLAKVGVFADEDTATVNEIARLCRLDYAQLCGQEGPGYCRQLTVPAIKAFRIKGPEDLVGLEHYAGAAKLFLLDSYQKGAYGGTGQTFPWELAREAASQHPIILAGGLNPDNVAQALETLSPWGVDVSSGVETSGIKDPAKIYAFVKAVRSYGGR